MRKIRRHKTKSRVLRFGNSSRSHSFTHTGALVIRGLMDDRGVVVVVVLILGHVKRLKCCSSLGGGSGGAGLLSAIFFEFGVCKSTSIFHVLNIVFSAEQALDVWWRQCGAHTLPALLMVPCRLHSRDSILITQRVSRPIRTETWRRHTHTLILKHSPTNTRVHTQRTQRTVPL